MEVTYQPDETIAAPDRLTVALAQIAPVWLDRAATLEKVMAAVRAAGDAGADLVVFGESLVPGYPFWVERTGGAAFNDARQKEIFAHYLDQGVVIERGDLTPLCALAAEREIAIYVGVMERAPDRGGHTLYASLVYINKAGEVCSVHRKLQPTYEERLVWGPGDGHGLRVHQLGAFTAGGLNCWENWLPLARAALYGQGEDLHICVWPGGVHNTRDLPPVIARELRGYVVAVSGLMRPEDVPDSVPFAAQIRAAGGDFWANGGSGVAAPDGSWAIAPVAEQEGLWLVDIDHACVRRERHNLDVVGHYSRPDVTELIVNRRRQSTVRLED